MSAESSRAGAEIAGNAKGGVSNEFSNELSAVLLCSIFGLLFAVYMLVYSGFPMTNDERVMIAASQTLARQGKMAVGQYYWDPAGPVIHLEPPETLPNFEVGQVLLAAPLQLAADSFGRVGNVQVMMLFNVAVTALTALLVAMCVSALGYDEAVSTVVGLVFGLATISLPYTKMFFREPLCAFSLTLTVYSLLRARAGGDVGQGQYLLLAVTGMALAFLVKRADALALVVLVPALAVAAWPHIRGLRSATKVRRFWWAALVLAAILLVAWRLRDVVMVAGSGGREWYVPAYHFLQFWRIENALYVALFSPGKSFFVYSPVLLASIPGAFLLWRRHRYGTVIIVALTVVYTVGYAMAQPDLRWGGLSWGPRFLVAVVPFVAILLAPVVERLLDRDRRRAWEVAVFAALLLLSLFVQYVGASASMAIYKSKLRKIAPDAIETIAIYEPEYSPPFYLARLLDRPDQLDFAWMREWREGGEEVVRVDAVPVAAAVLAGGLFVFGLAVSFRRRFSGRGAGAVAGITLLLCVLVASVSIPRYYDDPRFYLHSGAPPELRELSDYLNAHVAPDDVVVVNTHRYCEYLLNYGKFRAEWYALFEMQGVLVGDTGEMLDALKARHKRMWVVLGSLPPGVGDHPVEDWLRANATPLDEEALGGGIRVALYEW